MRGWRPVQKLQKLQEANEITTLSATATAPPYRNHLPEVVAAMTTLPFACGRDSTNAARTQPSATTNAALGDLAPQADSRQVAAISRTSRIAPSGESLLYWKLPSRPCTAPSTNSTRYVPKAAGLNLMACRLLGEQVAWPAATRAR